MDISKMKVEELRKALKDRGAETKGLKQDLQKRLQEIIDNELKEKSDIENKVEDIGVVDSIVGEVEMVEEDATTGEQKHEECQESIVDSAIDSAVDVTEAESGHNCHDTQEPTGVAMAADASVAETAAIDQLQNIGESISDTKDISALSVDSESGLDADTEHLASNIEKSIEAISQTVNETDAVEEKSQHKDDSAVGSQMHDTLPLSEFQEINTQTEANKNSEIIDVIIPPATVELQMHDTLPLAESQEINTQTEANENSDIVISDTVQSSPLAKDTITSSDVPAADIHPQNTNNTLLDTTQDDESNNALEEEEALSCFLRIDGLKRPLGIPIIVDWLNSHGAESMSEHTVWLNSTKSFAYITCSSKREAAQVRRLVDGTIFVENDGALVSAQYTSISAENAKEQTRDRMKEKIEPVPPAGQPVYPTNEVGASTATRVVRRVSDDKLTRKNSPGLTSSIFKNAVSAAVKPKEEKLHSLKGNFEQGFQTKNFRDRSQGDGEGLSLKRKLGSSNDADGVLTKGIAPSKEISEAEKSHQLRKLFNKTVVEPSLYWKPVSDDVIADRTKLLYKSKSELR